MPKTLFFAFWEAFRGVDDNSSSLAIIKRSIPDMPRKQKEVDPATLEYDELVEYATVAEDKGNGLLFQ